MNKQFIKETFGWGLLLWVFGYALSMMLFPFVPVSMMGWIISPIGTIVTIWVLYKKIKPNSLKYFFTLGVVWAAVAIAFDYIFIVKAFNPADGYYKLDVYLYYVLAFLLPVIVGWKKSWTTNPSQAQP